MSDDARAASQSDMTDKIIFSDGSPDEDGNGVTAPAAAHSDDFARPAGIQGSFGPNPSPPDYTPPPSTISPEQRAAFGRPAGVGAFDPRPGERIMPRHGVASPAVAQGAVDTFGRTEAGGDGFDPAPGTRIAPAGKPAESPWWKADAHRDPWRDPRSPSWLGRPAVLAAGRLEQLEPDDDTETDADALGEPEQAAEQETKKTRGRARFGLSALLLTLLVALVAGTIGGGVGFWLSDRANSALHSGDVKIATVGSPANRPPGSVAAIAAKVSPAVVSIDVQTPNLQGTGSGVVIDKAGYILTNNHVISAVATGGGTIRVVFSDQSSIMAKIVGRDPLTDLAVLKVDTTKLTVASLGDSSKLAVGDPVIAIGSPLGLRDTVTSGIVSALDRPVALSSSDSDTNAVIDAIQTDAAINPGNSGGALVDAAGAVVGIPSAGATIPSTSGSEAGSIGLGFAIPIDSARTIAEELIKTGKAVHASLGASTRSFTDGSQDGAYISQVVPGGPADKAGLKAGDVVTVADSTLITSSDELTVVVQKHKPGDTITLRYYRGSAQSEVKITLGSA